MSSYENFLRRRAEHQLALEKEQRKANRGPIGSAVHKLHKRINPSVGRQMLQNKINSLRRNNGNFESRKRFLREKNRRTLTPLERNELAFYKQLNTRAKSAAQREARVEQRQARAEQLEVQRQAHAEQLEVQRQARAEQLEVQRQARAEQLEVQRQQREAQSQAHVARRYVNNALRYFNNANKSNQMAQKYLQEIIRLYNGNEEYISNATEATNHVYDIATYASQQYQLAEESAQRAEQAANEIDLFTVRQQVAITLRASNEVQQASRNAKNASNVVRDLAYAHLNNFSRAQRLLSNFSQPNNNEEITEELRRINEEIKRNSAGAGGNAFENNVQAYGLGGGMKKRKSSTKKSNKVTKNKKKVTKNKKKVTKNKKKVTKRK